jgi:hypothetical protein
MDNLPVFRRGHKHLHKNHNKHRNSFNEGLTGLSLLKSQAKANAKG